MFASAGLVEALDLRNQILTLRSSRNYQPGEHSKVRVQLPPGTGKLVQVPIEILRPAGPNLYRARVLADLSGLDFRGTDPALRDSARYAVSLRVRSPDLPGFQGLAVDFSESGTQLEVSGPVAEGRKLDLIFDLDGYRLRSLACQAEVMWASSGQPYQLGCRFLVPSADLAQELSLLADFLGDRANSELESLLDKARLLARDPLSEPVLPPRARAPVVPTPPAAAPAPVPAPPAVPVVEKRPARPPLSLPLVADLDGYSRNLRSGSFYLRLVAGDEQVHTLEFPDCQVAFDHYTAGCRQLRTLRSWTESAWLDEVRPRLGPGSWKHYQLLSEDQVVLLELISRQCRGC